MSIFLPRRAALALPFLLPAARPALAQNMPWRPGQPARIVVPAAAGGTTDIVGRLFAAHCSARWGATVVADNRTGAGGIIGTQEVVRSKPDGLTLLSGNIGPQAIAYSLFRNLPYRPEQLQPVSNLIRGPNVVVVHPSLPVRSVPELVAYLKQRPGELSFGSPGIGQSPHLSAVWFTQLTGTQAIHVPFRGASPAMTELVAGNIQFMLDNLSTAIQQIRSGQVRALAVTSADRNPQLPELPTLRETMPELRQYEVNTWFGVFLPAGVPAEIVNAYNAEAKSMLASPEMTARVATMGSLPDYTTPAQYAAFVNGEIAKWSAVIRREGLQLDLG